MSRSPEQIGVIGAGSHIFTLNVMRDLCHTPGLEGSRVVLHDVNQERLANITTVCSRYAQELGVDIRVEAVSERQSAIKDSSYVVNTALAGGRETVERTKATVSQVTGTYGPVEAQAPFRQLKLMYDIAVDLANLSPDATLIQCANPLPEGCTIITRETGIDVIGVCHGYKEYEHLARLLGMNPDLVEAQIAGINHDVWLLKFLYEGQDAYPRIDDWIKNVSPAFYDYFLKYAKNVDYQLSRAAADLYRRFGLFPIGDTTRASTPDVWWYHTSAEIEEYWYGRERGFESAAGVASSLRWRQGSHEQMAAAAAGKESVQPLFPKHESGWQIIPIINSLVTGVPSVQQVNVPNRGAIAGLPEDFVVEIPAVIDGTGIHRGPTFTLPPMVMLNKLMPHWLQAERHINAFITRDPRYLEHQLLTLHKISDPQIAAEVISTWRDLDPSMDQHYKF